MGISLKNMAIALTIAMLPMSAVAETPGSGPNSAEQASESSLVAVEIYADWCPSCRALDPKMNAVIASGDWGGISFAKIDFTRRDRKAFFVEADALGVGEVFRDLFSRGIKTGLVLLVDVEHKRVVDVVTQADSVAEIEARLQKAQGRT